MHKDAQKVNFYGDGCNSDIVKSKLFYLPIIKIPANSQGMLEFNPVEYVSLSDGESIVSCSLEYCRSGTEVIATVSRLESGYRVSYQNIASAERNAQFYIRAYLIN